LLLGWGCAEDLLHVTAHVWKDLLAGSPSTRKEKPYRSGQASCHIRQEQMP
jgi:hypothetical protein